MLLTRIFLRPEEVVTLANTYMPACPGHSNPVKKAQPSRPLPGGKVKSKGKECLPKGALERGRAGTFCGIHAPGLFSTRQLAQETGYAFSFPDLLTPIWNQFSSKIQIGKGYQRKPNAHSLKDKRPAPCPLLAGLEASSPDGQCNTSLTTS